MRQDMIWMNWKDIYGLKIMNKEKKVLESKDIPQIHRYSLPCTVL